MKKQFFIFYLFFLLCFSCDKAEKKQTRLALGTVCSVNLFEYGKAEIYDEIFAKLDEIEQKMSAKLKNSELSLVNANAGIKAVTVSQETYLVVKTALEFAKMSKGSYDPTILPLSELWNVTSDPPKVPNETEIEKCKALIDYRNVVLDDKKQTIFLTEKGSGLDVGSAAKGFAADEICKILQAHKIPCAMLDFGGNIYAFGQKSTGKAWNIGIKNPLLPHSAPAVVVEIRQGSVVTSGKYERFFVENGKKYHHIIDTKTGYPVENDVASFTIISENSLKADILSTLGFTLGTQEGIAFVEKMKDASAICIASDGKITSTSNCSSDAIKILNSDFYLAN